ncbi:MAG TPA: hypothetical protein VJT67_09915, partial [Longimicrobiaceae bacterium]|nr:hypothetical protein [Longimicrobiaceae bacterium]
PAATRLMPADAPRPVPLQPEAPKVGTGGAEAMAFAAQWAAEQRAQAAEANADPLDADPLGDKDDEVER